MPHARRQIREKVAEVVTAGLTLAGTRVYPSRVYPHEQLPSLAVYTTEERLDDEGSDMGTRQTRELLVRVEARAKASSDLDDLLDRMCAEVEVALMADTTLDGLVEDLELRETEIDFAALDQQVGVARMGWAVMYRVDGTDPETIIP